MAGADRKESKKDRKDRKRSKKSKKSKSRKESKSKKSKETKKPLALTSQYGARGIITPADIFTKDAEFRAWMMEIKNISTDSIDMRTTKELFAEYMEDYNTATLPHEKFYDMNAWDRATRGASAPSARPGEETIDFSKDEEQLRSASKGSRLAGVQLMYTADELASLRKLQEDRIAADRLRKMGFQPKDSMGVRYE
ncbi:hypothetical protein HK105_204870 [Polyrhizophydium stewartii]|uniref:Uncharacterized protein n=1 Tax=Polyrhizophydium stewartii TaxID=2732419 RepID=A0ABR4N831_9FUNG